MSSRMILALVASVAIAGPVAAQSRPEIARATANLNMRTGPGTGFPVVATAPRGGGVTIFGCTPDRSWCDAAFANARGWVAARYLSYGGPGAYPPPPHAGGPVYKGDPADFPPPPAYPAGAGGYGPGPYAPGAVGPFYPVPAPCPRYPDRYFEHQVC